MDDTARTYLATLATRVAALTRARAELGAGTEGADDSIRRLAHVLRGSGTTFGYPQVTELAAGVEDAVPADLPRALDRLLESARSVIAASADGSTPILILVVEDDPVSLVLVQRELAAPNRRVVTAPTMAAAEWYLQNDHVSLAVLDLVLPDGDGRNFLVRLREQARTAATPIIVVSALNSAQVRTEAYALGCDAYLPKPVEMDVLAAAASALLERSGRAENEARRDTLTGLANRAGIRDAFVRMAAAAERSKAPLAAALVDLDGFKGQNDRHGHTHGDEILRAFASFMVGSLRRSDLMGRWGGDEFIVLLPDTDAEAAAGVLAGILEKLRKEPFTVGDATEHVTFTGGVAGWQFGATLDDTIGEADTLLYHGKSAGRGVVLSGAHDVAAIVRTVLLAEDDPMIVALLKHRLQRDGFDVVHAGDGNEALVLADQSRIALAILDVNMPGMNGFDLLEKLRKRPALSRTPIMMLTSVGKEADIARALALGADDYVIKPFSPVELLARVRRLVNRQ